MTEQRPQSPGPEGDSFPLYQDHYRTPDAPEYRAPDEYRAAGDARDGASTPVGSGYPPEPTNAELARPRQSTPAHPPPSRPTRNNRWGWLTALAIGAAVVIPVVANAGSDEPENALPVGGPVTSIEVTGSTQDVRIRTDDSVTEPSVRTDRGRPQDDMNAPVEDGVLKVDTNAYGDVVIVLPEGTQLQDISITSSTGDIRLDDVSAPSISLETTTGGIRVEDVSATEVNLRTTTGGVNGSFEDPVPETTRIETTTGEVEVEFPDGEYQVNTNTSTGDVEVDVAEGEGPGIDVRTTTGDIEIDDD